MSKKEAIDTAANVSEVLHPRPPDPRNDHRIERFRKLGPRRSVFGIRPEEIRTVEEAEMELLRERVRDSRWKRHKSQLRFILPAGAGGLLTSIVYLVLHGGL